MAIKTRDELVNALVAYIGEDTGEAAIELLDDLTDTIDDYVTRTSDSTDWKTKYEENDAEWRKRYIERFSRTEDPADGDNSLVVEESTEETMVEETPQTYEDLFKTESED